MSIFAIKSQRNFCNAISLGLHPNLRYDIKVNGDLHVFLIFLKFCHNSPIFRFRIHFYKYFTGSEYFRRDSLRY